MKKNKGSALFFALIIVTAMGILSAGFLSMVLSGAKNTERSNAFVNSMTVAEAGIEFGIWEVLHDGADYLAADGWSSTSVPTSNQAFLLDNAGNQIGEYRVTVSNPSGTMTVEATGGVPDLTNPSSQTPVIRVTLKSEPLFKKGLIGVSEVNLDNGVLVDSYDHTQGAYGGANIKSNGDIGTDSTANDAVEIGDFVLVKGDVYVGPGGNPADVIDYSGSGSITGSEIVSSEATNVPSVSAPTGLPDRGTLNVGFFQTKTISSSGEYDDINVSFGGTLKITNDATIYVKDDFNVVFGGQVKVENSADVDLVVGDTFNVALLSSIQNAGGDTADFAVYGLDTARYINILGLCTIQGTFYAPTAEVNLGIGVAVFGATIADEVNAGVLAGIHFDESLMTRTTAPNTGKVEVSTWQTK